MQAITELWKHRQNLEDTLTADLTRLMVYPPDFNLPRLSSEAALSNTQGPSGTFSMSRKSAFHCKTRLSGLKFKY